MAPFPAEYTEKIEEVTQMNRNAKQRREDLYSLLGRLPDRNAPIRAEILSRAHRDGYILEELVLTVDTAGEEPTCQPIPAYFLIPEGTGPFPAILYNHSHGGRYEAGKEELFYPAPYMQPIPYAEALTAMGYAVLCIDHWCFGQRSGRTESSVFKEMLWKGEYLWGRIVYDSLRALDYLCTRPEADNSRIATLGMSMGSTMAWWLAALEERIKVCVDLCCLTDYDALIARDELDQHGVYYYIPDLLRHFSAADINCLIAPRPHLGTVGMYDPLTPAEGVDRIEREVKAAYEAHSAAHRFEVLRYPVAHQETARMRADALAFLKEYL